MNKNTLTIGVMELQNLAYNTKRGHEKMVIQNMLDMMETVTVRRPNTWEDLIRDVAPTIDNSSPLDTFRSLLEECLEMEPNIEDVREMEFNNAAMESVCPMPEFPILKRGE